MDDEDRAIIGCLVISFITGLFIGIAIGVSLP